MVQWLRFCRRSLSYFSIVLQVIKGLEKSIPNLFVFRVCFNELHLHQAVQMRRVVMDLSVPLFYCGMGVRVLMSICVCVCVCVCKCVCRSGGAWACMWFLGFVCPSSCRLSCDGWHIIQGETMLISYLAKSSLYVLYVRWVLLIDEFCLAVTNGNPTIPLGKSLRNQ